MFLAKPKGEFDYPPDITQSFNYIGLYTDLPFTFHATVVLVANFIVKTDKIIKCLSS